MSRTIQSEETILRGATQLADAREAAKELAAQIGNRPAALRVVYVSASYDPREIGPALFRELGDAPLIGCTTAGEIGPRGYLGGAGLTGFALPADEFHVDLVQFPGIRQMDIAEIGRLASEGAGAHESSAGAGRSFGFLLVDGLCMREESLVSTIHGSLGGIPLCGGSAGDGLDFRSTYLLHDGTLREDCATLALVRTARDFEVFKLQHFLPSDRKLVVTGADPGRRVVTEIDGDIAALGYSEAIGSEGQTLTPQLFSTHPVVVHVGGKDYVRAIQRVEPDGSLVFYCAIDVGIVLTLASGIDIVDNLKNQVGEFEERMGDISLTIGFDCILRRLESKEKQVQKEVNALLRRLSLCGFATYGEQFGAMHVNQTLTGVVLGPRAA